MHVIVIGFSAGGLEPLMRIVRGLPPGLPAAIIVTFHMSIERKTHLHMLLGDSLPAGIAVDGEKIESGRIYVARPGYHMVAEPPGVLRLTLEPKEDGFRPSINKTMRSVASTYGNKAVGVVLSGSLYDGTKGLLDIKQNGGITIVQDYMEAAFPSMPLSAIKEDGNIDHVLKSGDIANRLITLVA